MSAEMQNSGVESGLQLDVRDVRGPPDGSAVFALQSHLLFTCIFLEVHGKC